MKIRTYTRKPEELHLVVFRGEDLEEIAKWGNFTDYTVSYKDHEVIEAHFQNDTNHGVHVRSGEFLIKNADTGIVSVMNDNYVEDHYDFQIEENWV